MDLKRWPISQNLGANFAAHVKRAYLAGISSKKDAAADALKNSPWRIGLMEMKNGDVYSIARSMEDIPFVGVRDTKWLLPRVPVKIDALCGQEIREVSSGSHHVVVLTADGRIYQWGVKNFAKNPLLTEPPELLSVGIETERLVQIACGESHTLALTLEGEVYSWGRNGFGQLGTGSAVTSTRDPVKVSGMNGFDAKIVSVACSGWTSFALDNDGTVWSWGDDEDGAVGLGYSSSVQMHPKKIALDNVRIKKIAAGNTHVLALSVTGELYFWGRHVPEMQVCVPEKIAVPNEAKVTDIGAMRGCGVSAFETSDARIGYWGFAIGYPHPQPVTSSYTSLAEMFASLDISMMLKPVEFHFNEQIVTEKLNMSFNDEETADITFNVEKKPIYAHREFLKLRSCHFRRMFDNDWKEKNEGAVEIRDCAYGTFHTFLKYLYTDRIEPFPLNVADTTELFKLAHYYDEDDLKRRCEENLKRLMTKINFSQVYSVASLYDSATLRQVAHDFGIPNFNDLVQTQEYRNMPNELKNQFIEELAAKKVFVGLTAEGKQ